MCIISTNDVIEIIKTVVLKLLFLFRCFIEEKIAPIMTKNNNFVTTLPKWFVIMYFKFLNGIRL